MSIKVKFAGQTIVPGGDADIKVNHDPEAVR